MILYVNGDSHAAAAEAVNSYGFAEDDPDLYHLGRRPHPDNLKVSWARLLADNLGRNLICDAEAASSNQRILRTTRDWLAGQTDLDSVLIIIQWSTWERQEWLINGQHWQVNASGIDHVPDSAQQRYRDFVCRIDWTECTDQAHQQIWQFHLELSQQNVAHIFFNGNSHFASVHQRHDWGTSYLTPYETNGTFDAILRNQRFRPVNPQSWHFGADAHCFWADFMLQYIMINQFVT